MGRRARGTRVRAPWADRGGTLAALALLAAPLLPTGSPAVAPARLAAPGAPVAAAAPPAARYVTVSPAPGSRTADPATEISFLGRPIGTLGTVSVVGSSSGRHLGKLLAYSTGDGASFVPARPFVPGEQVTVHTSLPIAHAAQGTFRFSVAHVVALRLAPTRTSFTTDVAGVDHFASAPTLEPPAVRVVVSKGAPPRGDLLLTPKGPTGQPGPMLVAPDGRLVWFRPLPPGQQAFDLNEQTLHGRPVLTWFQGRVVDGHGEGVAVIADEHYRTIAVVRGGNGTEVDLHELQLTNAGTAIVTAYRPVRWNLSSAHGSSHGVVYDGVVQEIDLATGLVEEEWDSLDHVPVVDSYLRAPTSSTAPYDYFHVNAVQPLAGGALLVSARNTSAVYAVDPATGGTVRWCLGGKASTLRLSTGARFWYQHDVRLHQGDLLTVFDNGSNGSSSPEPASRALVLRLDLVTRRAFLVRSVVNPLTHVLAFALGSVQDLTGGSLLVGWGTAPSVSVVAPSGAVRYDATLPTGDNSYRAVLHPWTGAPTTRPSLAVVRAVAGSGVTVSMSWNGATGVARWRVRSGRSAAGLRQVAVVANHGFESTVRLAEVGSLVQVMALGGNGAPLGSSAVLRS